MQESVSGGTHMNRVVNIWRQHLMLIISVIIICTGLGFGVAKWGVAPEYTASTELLVNQPAGKGGLQAPTAPNDGQLIATYKDFVGSRTVLVPVQKQLRRDGLSARITSMKALQDAITVTNKQNSRIFTIAVRAKTPTRAAQTANLVTQTFKRQVRKVMGRVPTIDVVSTAVAPSHPSFPNVKLFTLAGGLFGMLICLVGSVLTANRRPY